LSRRINCEWLCGTYVQAVSLLFVRYVDKCETQAHVSLSKSIFIPWRFVMASLQTSFFEKHFLKRHITSDSLRRDIGIEPGPLSLSIGKAFWLMAHNPYGSATARTASSRKVLLRIQIDASVADHLDAILKWPASCPTSSWGLLSRCIKYASRNKEARWLPCEAASGLRVSATWFDC
jgi:hypothetical protein